MKEESTIVPQNIQPLWVEFTDLKFLKFNQRSQILIEFENKLALFPKKYNNKNPSFSLPFVMQNSHKFKKHGKQAGSWGMCRGEEKRQSATYTIAADSGKGVLVACIHEVEPDSIEWALPLRELATRLIQPLQARTID